jgi:hypothetical protein
MVALWLAIGSLSAAPNTQYVLSGCAVSWTPARHVVLEILRRCDIQTLGEAAIWKQATRQNQEMTKYRSTKKQTSQNAPRRVRYNNVLAQA